MMLFILFMLTVEWVQRFESHGLVLHKIKSRDLEMVNLSISVDGYFPLWWR
jgi:hypothetical protein